ncbi:RNA 2',3'-cyclic phosphodiesterase [Tessaracoccus sp. OS52]|uniref:RNA 2',3'-cyclic phosphodiesterase n=1 Tax=Tessaracoccus sp. OS52 TaxID=2886691 RepID=UPI001D113A4D|nr:RNA 2',3'-cyclic phosphodiesterase [Tessaracoccus sp. OS52]MCC2592394.1 RNA 2',3'-cyclic phosphodiesterase [Tessaracoccus sp. OS52]
MGARLFTAVLPPPSVVHELTTWLEPRREAGVEVWRWTRPEGWHLTTAFMSSVPVDARDRLVEGLAESLGRVQRFDVGVQGAVCFPGVERAKALALGLADGKEELAALARKCRAVAAHAGAAPDGSAFVGHLTLARARRPFDATKWFHVVDAFPGWSWPVEDVVLVESHLADKGNRYEVVERFGLSST